MAVSGGTISAYNPNPIQQAGDWLGNTASGIQNWFTGGNNGTTPISGNTGLQQLQSIFSPSPVYAQGSIPGSTYSPIQNANAGQVQGANTQAPANNGGGGGQPQQQQQGGQPSSQFNDFQKGIIDAYNNLVNTMESAKPGLSQGLQNALGIIGGQKQQNQADLERNQGTLTTQNQLTQGQLGQSYQDQLANNRELARSMGSFGSDYAQLQNRAGSTYGQNQLGAYNTFQGGMGQLMSQTNQANAQLDMAANQLNQQYNDSLRQIALAEGQSDAQKISALSNLQNNYMYMNSLIASVKNYSNPTSSIAGPGLGATTQQTQQTMGATPQAYAQQNTYTPGQSQNMAYGGPTTNKDQNGNPIYSAMS